MAWNSSADGDALLDAVDDRELVGALRELRVGHAQLVGALRDRLLEVLRALRVVERDRGLAREHGHEVAIGIAEAPERAVEIGVQVADDLAARHQRRDDARALVERIGVLRLVQQRRRTRAPHAVDERRHRVEQRGVVLALRRQDAGERPRPVLLEHEQHALGAGELGDLLDQELVQRGDVAQLVHPRAGVHQPLEGRMEVDVPLQVRRAALHRQAPAPRMLDPGAHDVAVRVDLVEEAAAQALVAERLHPAQQVVVGGFQRGRRAARIARQQRAIAPPPDRARGLAGARALAAARLQEVERGLRLAHRTVRVAGDEARVREVGEDEDLVALVVHAAHVVARTLEQRHRVGVAAQQRHLARHPVALVAPARVVAQVGLAAEQLVEPRAGRVEVARRLPRSR